MRRSRAAAVHQTGDRVLSQSRRILATCGLHGAANFHVSDAASGGIAQIKPEKDTERVVVRTPPIRLTPGCFPRVSIVYLPSGETEKYAAGAWNADGVKGEVVVDVEFDNGGTVTERRVVPLEGSVLANGSQPTGAGAAWAALRTYHGPPIVPADFALPANVADWTQNAVTATITISYVGSPRVIDLCVYEMPVELGVDLSAGGWIAPMHSTSNGDPLAGFPAGMPAPQTKRSASDPGFGSEALVDAAARMCQELGPVLFMATAWDEGGQDVAQPETDYASISTTALLEIVSGSSANWSTSRDGWSIASGANARRVQDSETVKVLRDVTNVVPVRCYIYGAMSTAVGSPTAKVRFESQTYSISEVAVSAGTSYAWHSAPGYLRCGLGAQDPVHLQVRAQCSAVGVSFRWRYVAVVYDGSI